MIRRVLRVLLPAAILVAWLGAAAVGGPYFGRVSEVSSNDQASYLPASAEATRVSELVPEFTGSDDPPAIVVAARDGGLTAADLDWLDGFAADAGSIEGVSDPVSPVLPAEDGDAARVVLTIAGELDETVERVAERFAGAPRGLVLHVTGPAGFAADLVGAFRGIDGLLLAVALAAVLLILLIVYRSPLLPILVLGTASIALAASILVVWWLAYADVVRINGQVQGILFILVIGAATDYALLYVSRYREALAETTDRWAATRRAWRGSLEPILASGLTVIAALLCLLLSDLTSNRALGPVGAIGIAFSILAALTLLPALLVFAGRVAFWPRRPVRAARATGLWPRVAGFVDRRARAVWIVSTLVLLAAGLGLTQLRADGVPQSALVLGESDARDGQVLLGEHFPGGSGSPALIVGDADEADALADAALEVVGVSDVVAVSADSPSGFVPVGTAAPPAAGPQGADAGPTVVDGRVLLQVTLEDAADSRAAEDSVVALRAALDDVDPEALVGGVTAIALDTDATAIRDRTVIIPVVLGVILLILALLLRAIVAPLLLIASVIASFAAALGISAVAFEVLGFPGADPAVPLFAFVFLVALGVDYNIFLMSRVREESLAAGTREGVLRGLVVTGGVITSAGIVLAATFAALGVIPILFLVQIAVIVAVGVLLDTVLVRSLLVPALAVDIGRGIWWPSPLSRGTSPGESQGSDATRRAKR
jgi:RND superfamily putative drug exporter